MIQIPDQRVSTTKKKTDTKWYCQNADAIIELAITSNDKQFTIECLNAANGVIDKSDYAHVLSTYMAANEATKVEKDLDIIKLGKLRDVDILSPIKDRYMGEFINSYHNYQVYSLDPDVIIRRNHEIGTKVVEMMFKKLQQILSSQEEGSPQIDIKSFVDKELEEWKDNIVIKEQESLELLNALIEAKRKYIEAYFYWWACEEVYTYRRLVGKDVHFEIVDPREYYRVDSGNYFVEDDHYGLRRSSITFEEIISQYYNNMEDGLTEKQMNFIRDYMKGLGKENAPKRTVYLEHIDAFPQFTNPSDLPSGVSFSKDGHTIQKDHYVFTTEIKRGILTYMSPTGDISEMDVDEDYVLNTAEGDISIEFVWTSQKWEGWVFGHDAIKIYIPPRPVELERELVSNVNVCKSPYNGISYIHAASAKKPVAYRLKDYVVLYKIYTLLEERWLNKFKSWLLIPESIISDSEELLMEDRLQQADTDSLLPFNDTDLASNPNAVSMFREVATTAVISYVTVLNQVKQSIKKEAWELSNMNESRLGQNSPYKGKGLNEQDYNQAVAGTIWSLEMFNSFRERDYMANLDFSRAAWIDGKQGSFIDPSTGKMSYANIDGLDHLGANIGIFISNSAELNAQAKALQELAFSMGQNDDPAIAAEAVTNKNISKLKELINKASKAKKDFQLEMSTAAEKIKQETEQLRVQDNQAQRDHESQLHTDDNAASYEEKILESETLIAINDARLEVDRNGNGYIDQEESTNTRDTIEAKERARGVLERRKQALNELKTGIAMKNANKPKPK